MFVFGSGMKMEILYNLQISLNTATLEGDLSRVYN